MPLRMAEARREQGNQIRLPNRTIDCTLRRIQDNNTRVPERGTIIPRIAEASCVWVSHGVRLIKKKGPEKLEHIRNRPSLSAKDPPPIKKLQWLNWYSQNKRVDRAHPG